MQYVYENTMETNEMRLTALYDWCSVPAEKLENHPDVKIPFRLIDDSREMGIVMAEELAQDIKEERK